MASKTKRLSERSNQSNYNHCADRDSEYFWSVVLNTEKRSVTWLISDNADEEGEGNDLIHTLFLKSAVLGGNAVSGEQNVVVLQSTGEDGKTLKGAIAHLIRGQHPMTPLDLTIPGRIGATFILSEGSGPVTISGNHLVEFEKDDELISDIQMDEFTEGEEENIGKELDESDDESEEEVKGKKSTKRKATPKTVKHKQKAKIDVEDDDQSGEDEEEDDDDDDDDDDYEDDVKTKKSKKAKVAGKKNEKAGKSKPEKDSGKKGGKNVKK